MNTPALTQLLDHFEAAELLSMLPPRLKRMAKRGEVPAVILPDGEIRFDPADLRDWVEGCKTTEGTPA